MNRIFHSIWNRALGAWVAAPETARAASAGSASCVLAAPTTPHLPRLGWRPTALALAVAAWVPGVAMAVPVGPSISVSGDVQSAGTPAPPAPASPWNLGNNALMVGAQTNGRVDISDGATVTSSSVYLAQGSVANGTVSVQGLGSRLTTQGLYVGYSGGGTGTLHISNGGAVSSAYAHVGESPSQTGFVIVSGSGSTWTNSGTLLLGVHGIGILTIEQGAQVKTGAITLGSGTPATAQGFVELYGNAASGRGVLETTQLTKVTSASVLNINGGILRASAHQSDFLKGFTALTLGVEGAYFDTNGYNMGVGTAFASPAGGGLFKQGAGTLTLRGASTYSGGTTISGGTLVAANASALGTGDVTVGQGAALEVASGTALTVGGDLTFQPGSTYRVYANPNGSASSVHASGTATLAGSVLHVGPKSDFAVATPYTILTADGGIAPGTQFDAVQSSYAFLTATLGYTPNSVTLTLQGVEDFGRRVNTANQQATVRSVQNLGSSNPVYQHLVQAEDSQAAAMANSLSGDTHAGVQSSLGGLSGVVASVSAQHGRSSLTAGMHPGAAVAQSDGPLPASAWPSSKALPAWAEVVGHWQRYDGDGNAATLKQRTTGLFLGMDQEVGTSGWRLGGSLGYTNADGKVADRASESDVNSYSAAVYGGKSFGTGVGPRINVLGGLAYTWHDIETTRRIESLGQTLKADYSAHTAQLFAEVGYAIGQYDQFGFEPFVGVSLGQQRTGSFQERGGFAALQGRSNTDDLASTTLGLRMHSDLQVAGKDARLRATVGWRHAFGDVATSKTMAFEGGQNFTVAGAPLARNTAVLGLEGEVALSRTAALVLGYRGELGSGQRDHAANVKLRWAF